MQAKYGITDHKTTMEIVHQLKTSAGVDFKSTQMPDKITLPATVTVDGSEISLKDVDAAVSGVHMVRNQVDTPTAIEIDGDNNFEKYTSNLEKDLSKVTTITNFDKSVENAGKTIEAPNGSGEYLEYDDDGNLAYIYSNQKMAEEGKPAVSLTAGSADRLFEYDQSGEEISKIDYNENGIAYSKTYICDKQGTERTIYYNPNGSVKEFEDLDISENDVSKTTYYDKDGKPYKIHQTLYLGNAKNVNLEYEAENGWHLNRKVVDQ